METTPIRDGRHETRSEPAGSLSMVQTLTSYKAWANEVLFTGLWAVPEPELMGDFNVISLIMDHMQVVDLIFQAHLQGVKHGFTATRTTELRSLREFSERALAIDRWYVEYTKNVSEETLLRRSAIRFTDGKTIGMSPAEMILHVVNHGTYHRGNIGVILQKNGVAPGRDGLPDYFSRGVDAP